MNWVTSENTDPVIVLSVMPIPRMAPPTPAKVVSVSMHPAEFSARIPTSVPRICVPVTVVLDESPMESPRLSAAIRERAMVVPVQDDIPMPVRWAVTSVLVTLLSRQPVKRIPLSSLMIRHPSAWNPSVRFAMMPAPDAVQARFLRVTPLAFT